MRNRLFLFILFISGLLSNPLYAATIQVDSTADANMGSNCSLRDAISSLNNGSLQGGCNNSSGDGFGTNDTVTLPAGDYTLTVSGAPNDDNTSGDLDILTDMAIVGADPDNPQATTIDAAGLSPRDRVFHIIGNVPPNMTMVVLDSLNIINGRAPDRVPFTNNADGGGIHVGTENGLEIFNSRVADNQAGDGINGLNDFFSSFAGYGGGIYQAGGAGMPCLLLVDNTLIEGNRTGNGGEENPLATGGAPGGFGGGIFAASELLVNQSTIRNNQTGNGARGSTGGGLGGLGGGIAHQPMEPNTALITHSTINNNNTGNGGSAENTSGGSGGGGGGVYLSGSFFGAGGSPSASGAGFGLSATLSNNTISGNTTGNGGDGGAFGGSGGIGGGVQVQGGMTDGMVTLNNNTVVNNQTGIGGTGTSFDGSGGNGGGISTPINMNMGSGPGGIITVNLANNIVANNNIGTGGTGPNCAGPTLVDDGYNLESETDCGFTNNGQQNANPLLGPLADNGGPTDTHALMQGSPARDNANPGATGSGFPNCESDDQRGVTRPQGPQCDIGAFEAQIADLLVIKTVQSGTLVTDVAFQFNITVTNNGPTDASGVLLEDTLPAGLTFVSATPDQGSCLAAGLIISCDLGDIANGATVNIVVEVIATNAGTSTNTATVAFPGIDPDPSNDTSSVDFTVVANSGFLSGSGCQLGSQPMGGPSWALLALALVILGLAGRIRFS